MPSNQTSSQKFVPIKEIRDGIAVLNDNSMRMVLMASSLNFALKSAEEQEAIILQFQNFLNSLDFSVELFIQSRRLDIRPYIATLEERQKSQTNELLQIQIREYIGFIRNFAEQANVMSKSFFVVIPYQPPILSAQSNVIDKMLGRETKAKEAATFEECRSQLEQRVSVVEQGLIRTGVRIIALGTEELIELYYKIFNPGELQGPIKSEL